MIVIMIMICSVKQHNGVFFFLFSQNNWKRLKLETLHIQGLNGHAHSYLNMFPKICIGWIVQGNLKRLFTQNI